MRFLAAILLIAALAPGGTVLCLSLAGHLALESQFATCCAALSVPFQDVEPAVLSQTSQSCFNCTDTPVPAVRESRFQVSSNKAVFAPVTPPALPIASPVFRQNLALDDALSSADSTSLSPLRC